MACCVAPGWVCAGWLAAILGVGTGMTLCHPGLGIEIEMIPHFSVATGSFTAIHSSP